MAGRNGNYYGANKETVNLTDVTSSPENAIILQKLRDDDPGLTELGIGEHTPIYENEPSFIVREGDDLGWLGYLIGGNTTLSYLNITYLPQEKWRSLAFIREIVSNRSIQHLQISTDLGDGFHSLGTLLKSDTLVTLQFESIQCARNVAIMLGQQNQHNHFTSLIFEDIDISGEAMAEIATALSVHPQLEELYLSWITPPGGRPQSVALGRMLEGWKKPNLKDLTICCNVFDEEGLHALVAGMRNCRNLTRLSIIGGDSITANGCRSLSTLFQSENCCLEHLHLTISNIDGYCAAALATGLVNLCSLKSLSLAFACSSFRDGLSGLVPAIASLRLLETLNLARNSIGNDGTQAIAGELANFNFLEVLNLSYSSIGNEGARAIAAGLTGLRSLKKLDLSGNSIGDNGISALALALASLQSLEELYLSNNSIGDEGLQALVEGISHCFNLSQLNLSNNRSITSLGVVSLSALLRSGNCSLAVLELDFIRIDNDGAAALADGLKGNKLTDLRFTSDLAGLTPVSDGWKVCCISCRQAENDDIKLKECDGGCNLVKYCSDACQENHREQHEEECKKRLRDKKLFAQPDETHLGECMICFLPLPLDLTKSVINSCCCKYICNGCDYANKKREREQGLQHRCPFCRERMPDTDEEIHQNYMKRVKANDPVAFSQMGTRCRLAGDFEGALEYFTKAAELGDTDAHYELSIMYQKGQGVEKDQKKVIYHWEEAAIGGHPEARYYIGVFDRFDRAKKHYIIAANLGHDDSLKELRKLYADGHASKEDYANALRAWQSALDATKSVQRKKAEKLL